MDQVKEKQPDPQGHPALLGLTLSHSWLLPDVRLALNALLGAQIWLLQRSFANECGPGVKSKWLVMFGQAYKEREKPRKEPRTDRGWTAAEQASHNSHHRKRSQGCQSQLTHETFANHTPGSRSLPLCGDILGSSATWSGQVFEVCDPDKELSKGLQYVKRDS